MYDKKIMVTSGHLNRSMAIKCTPTQGFNTTVHFFCETTPDHPLNTSKKPKRAIKVNKNTKFASIWFQKLNVTQIQ